MKIINKIWALIIFLSFSIFGLIGSISIAATTPSLGEAASFGILSSTYTNTIAAGTINGDIGYTTAPVAMPTVNGTLFVPSPSQAGADQNTALTNLNSQGCTFTFAAGITDLAADTTHNPLLAPGVYEPGVYCTDGAASTAAVTLSGAGTYIFRIAGALDMVDTTSITLTNGASACDVFWTPIAKTTLGANTNFVGTVIDDAGITVGDGTSWIGRALAFGETVTTDNSTISVPTCLTKATLNVFKHVVNDGGGSLTASSFKLNVKRFGTIVGSGIGNELGTSYLLSPGTYAVDEDTNPLYTKSFSGACNVTLLAGENKTCTIINTYIYTSNGGGGGTLRKDVCPTGDYSDSYYDRKCGTVPIITGNIIIRTGNVVTTGNLVTTGNISSTGNVVTTGNISSTGNVTIDSTVYPGFPKTGLPPEGNNTFPWNIIILISVITAFASFVIALRKRVI